MASKTVTQDTSLKRSFAESAEEKDTMLGDVQPRHPCDNHRETTALDAKGWASEGQPIQLNQTVIKIVPCIQ